VHIAYQPLAYSLELSPIWEANIRSAGQEIHYRLCKEIHDNMSEVPISEHLNAADFSTMIWSALRYPKWYRPFKTSDEVAVLLLEAWFVSKWFKNSVPTAQNTGSVSLRS
jgi:hypothetical protein